LDHKIIILTKMSKIHKSNMKFTSPSEKFCLLSDSTLPPPTTLFTLPPTRTSWYMYDCAWVVVFILASFPCYRGLLEIFSETAYKNLRVLPGVIEVGDYDFLGVRAGPGRPGPVPGPGSEPPEGRFGRFFAFISWTKRFYAIRLAKGN